MTMNEDANNIINNLISKPSCPICKGSSVALEEMLTIHPGSAIPVKLRQCDNCRHWWHDPAPSQAYLTSLYESSSEFVVPKGYAGMMQSKLTKQPRFNLWVHREEQANKGNHMLEIGVGGGHLFNYMVSKGYLCHGIEPGCWAGTPDIYPDIESLPCEKYDFIVMSDVIEHLESPLDSLRMISQKASKGSRLYCSFPNKDSLPAYLKQGRWDMVRPFGHLHYFSSESTRILMAETGWEIVDMKKANADHNVLLNSINPLTFFRKIRSLPSFWHDQLWVKAVFN